MKIIQLKRGAGKTRRILKKLTDDPTSVLVVINEQTRSAILRELQNQDPWFSAYRVVNFQRGKLVDQLRGYPVKKIFVDNLDLMLPALLGTPFGALIDTVTINDDVRTKDADGNQLVEVENKWAYYWDEPSRPLRVGDRVVLPPATKGGTRWKGYVTALGTKYEGPVKPILAKI